MLFILITFLGIAEVLGKKNIQNKEISRVNFTFIILLTSKLIHAHKLDK